MTVGSTERHAEASFAIIDFEASSLDENSYPIEVGLAIVRKGMLSSWSSLICPTTEWRSRDAWSRSSERVHRISREMLADGPSPAEVASALVQQTAGLNILHCDGDQYDQHWLDELVRAACVVPNFRLAEVTLLVKTSFQERFATLMAEGKPPHRAGGDARRIAETVLAVGSHGI